LGIRAQGLGFMLHCAGSRVDGVALRVEKTMVFSIVRPNIFPIVRPYGRQYCGKIAGFPRMS